MSMTDIDFVFGYRREFNSNKQKLEKSSTTCRGTSYGRVEYRSQFHIDCYKKLLKRVPLLEFLVDFQ